MSTNPSKPRRSTFGSTSLRDFAAANASESTGLLPGDSLSRQVSYDGEQPKKRHTMAFGEQYFPSRHTTWKIEDANESMDDVAIVVNLLADLSPAGVLPLSFGMIGTGYVPSIILLLVFAAAAGYMMYLVSRSMEHTGKQSFDSMWSDVVSPRTAWVPVFTVWSVCFGCCLAYSCMFGDLFAGCMPAFGMAFATRTVCLIVLAVVPLLPLCMLKDLSLLAPTSFAALLSVLFTLIMMVVRYSDGSYARGGVYYTEVPPSEGSHMMTLGASSFLLINGLAVAFLCHYNGCKYYREFCAHTPAKFGRRISLAFCGVSAMFAIAMIFGYATFGAVSDGVILNNYSGQDMFANLARVGMGVANVCSFPLMFSGLREQSLALIVFCMPSMRETCDLVVFQNMFSATMLVIITIVAILVTDCSLVVGLVGSICGSATIYVLPCILFDCAFTKVGVVSGDGAALYSRAEQILVRTIGSVGVFLMVAGAIATLCL